MKKTFSGNEGGDGQALPWDDERLRKIVDGTPLRTLVLFGNGALGFKSLEVMIAWMNGRYLKALARMLRK